MTCSHYFFSSFFAWPALSTFPLNVMDDGWLCITENIKRKMRYQQQLLYLVIAVGNIADAWQYIPGPHRRSLFTRRLECPFSFLLSSAESQSVHNLDLNDKAVPELQRRLECEDKELVQLEGYLASVRQFGPSFCFLDLSKRGVTVPVQAMLKRQEFEDADRFDACMKSLVPGIRICVSGPVKPTRNPGEALILIRDIRILALPRNPQQVRKLLRLVSEGVLRAQELAQATNMTEHELLQAIDHAKTTMKPGHPKMFNCLTNTILGNLQEEHDNDEEYPILSDDHKWTHSLPMASSEIMVAPIQRLSTVMKKEEAVGPTMSVQGALIDFDRMNNDGAVRNIHVVTGWVQNRRRFQNSISVLEVVDEMVPVGASSDYVEKTPVTEPSSFSKERIKCVLHPDSFHISNSTDLYGHVSTPGCRVCLTGKIVIPSTNQNNGNDEQRLPIFWIHQMKLLTSSWRPTYVQFIVEQVVAGQFDLQEAAESLKLSHQEMNRIVSLEDLTKRQWEGSEIARRLQQQAMDGFHADPVAHKTLQDLEFLRTRYPLTVVDAVESKVKKGDFVSTPGSRWKRKKEPQLDWMTNQIKEVLSNSYPDRVTDSAAKPFRILDVGGGKGFLANHLARRLEDCGYHVEILVLDVAEGAVHNGRRRAKRRNLSHIVRYEVADASNVDLSDYGGKFDVVVALHACGTLTDVALGHAVHQQAAFVICPCCFLSNPQLTVPISRQGVLAREWMDIDPEPFERIKNLAETQLDLNLANCAIHSYCGLRVAAVERHACIPMNVSIKTFPVAFSTRNFCLVGSIAV